MDNPTSTPVLGSEPAPVDEKAIQSASKPSETTPAVQATTTSISKPRSTAHNAPTLSIQDFAAIFLQALALIIALVFGAWAIKSYNAAEAANNLSSASLSASDDSANMANSLALVANQLALLTLCLGLNNVCQFDLICFRWK